MKICDLTQSYTATSGGIRTYIHEKQKYIKERTSFEHILICPGETDEIVQEGRLTTATIKSDYIPNCKPYRFAFRLDKADVLLKQIQPDIIELGSAYVFPLLAFKHQKKYNTALVGFYHTDYPTAYVEPTIHRLTGPRLAKAAKALSNWYVKTIYNRFDLTVTSSTQLEANLTQMGIRNIKRINLGVDLDLFHPGKRCSGIRKKFLPEQTNKILIYAGRFDEEKQIDVILDAFNKISDHFQGVLIMIGEGPLKPLAMEFAGRNPKIHILPYLQDREALAAMLASADIYISAGPHETFGLSIIEAQACGLPVLGVDAGALQERVPSSVGLLGTPGCPDAMAANMLTMSQNGIYKKGKAARELIEKNFSWETTFHKLFHEYEELFIQKQIAREQSTVVRFS